MSIKPELPYVTIDNDKLYLWAILGSDNTKLEVPEGTSVWPGDILDVPAYEMKDWGDPP